MEVIPGFTLLQKKPFSSLVINENLTLFSTDLGPNVVFYTIELKTNQPKFNFESENFFVGKISL
jgi:hypothetical protein